MTQSEFIMKACVRCSVKTVRVFAGASGSTCLPQWKIWTQKNDALWVFIAVMTLILLAQNCVAAPRGSNHLSKKLIVASDSILSGILVSLLPPNKYQVEVILPPGQCPGHYDVKISDIEKMKRASLIVTFRGMSFLDQTVPTGNAHLIVDAGGRNWMAPDSYISGLGVIADELSKRFPDDKGEILRHKEAAARSIIQETTSIRGMIMDAQALGKPLIASSMQREPLQWMGFRVVADYGGPETMSAFEVARLSRIGKEQQVVAVVDNLQSGPDAGKGIAEALGVRHVVLTNFPSEKGYIETLKENARALLTALRP